MLPSLKLHRSHVAAGKCRARICDFLTFVFVIAKGICGLHSCSGQELCRCLRIKVYATLKYFSKIIAAKGRIRCLLQNTKNNALKCQNKKATQEKNQALNISVPVYSQEYILVQWNILNGKQRYNFILYYCHSAGYHTPMSINRYLTSSCFRCLPFSFYFPFKFVLPQVI